MPNKTRKKRKPSTITFKDYPEFTPNLTPQQIFQLGSFGGTYWRPIYSKTNKRNYKNVHKKFPKSWWKGLENDELTSPDYDKEKNKYGVKVGLSLDYWEKKKWMYPKQRCEDDERQIKRWKGLAGPKGRFMRFLVTQILKKGAKYDDESVSPKIRQVLQHWAYVLTKKDFNSEVKRREK